ncbi:MAG: cytochrome c maturation protein CcmE [Pseudomonadota bacterium]|nr:cytochrome c maturation protein CcmE [Pseudomonadota bacterium]
MKPKHQRLLFITVSMMFLCAATLLTLRAFRDNLVFFYSPSDLTHQAIPPDRTIRIGGLVAAGSIAHSGQRITFVITDGTANISVAYEGMLPSLFREGQGVVAEGHLADPAHFLANTILAKHDEKYMPREVVDALKRSGQWRGQ